MEAVSEYETTKRGGRMTMFDNLQENETLNISPYSAVDEFVCLKCGIALENYCKQLFDSDGEQIGYGEYVFKFCPECGRKINKSEDTDNE